MHSFLAEQKSSLVMLKSSLKTLKRRLVGIWAETDLDFTWMHKDHHLIILYLTFFEFYIRTYYSKNAPNHKKDKTKIGEHKTSLWNNQRAFC